MSLTTDDPCVVLYGISRSQYEKILETFGEYHLRHTYDRGALEVRSLLYGVAWEDYLAFLRILGDHTPRHSFDRGTFEMMSPRKDHEWVKTILGRMIELMCSELDIDIQSIGSTTIMGSSFEQGLQPDEAYYVANESLIRGKNKFEPGKDPPPDLVIEVDVTNSSVKRMPMLAAIGVPEVWHRGRRKLRFLLLNAKKKYVETDRSLAFPFITPADIERFLEQREAVRETKLVRDFAKWAKAAAKK